MDERRAARTRAAWLLASLLVAKVAMADAAPPDPRRLLARKLVIAGEVLLGAGYVTSASISFSIGIFCGSEPGEPLCQQSRFLWGALPLAGPWVQLGYDHDFASSVALFTVPALVQAGGAALIIAGIVVNRRARSDAAPR